MGIQIDGSANTISGLAVGGLPNGSISSDDIASNAVTTAKLDSNAVTVDKLASTLDLSSNTVTLPNTSVTAGMLASTLDISGKTVTLPNTSVTAGMLASTLDLSSKTVTLPSGTGGKVLQVVSTTYEGVGSVSTPPETFTDISGFSVSITPSSTNSKVLIMVQVGRAGANHAGARQVNFRIMRGTTAIAVPSSAAGSRVLASFSLSSTDVAYNNSGGMTILDSPSTTSATTYKVQMATQVDNQAVRINTAGNDTDSNDAPYARTVSTITAMEVAA